MLLHHHGVALISTVVLLLRMWLHEGRLSRCWWVLLLLVLLLVVALERSCRKLMLRHCKLRLGRCELLMMLARKLILRCKLLMTLSSVACELVVSLEVVLRQMGELVLGLFVGELVVVRHVIKVMILDMRSTEIVLCNRNVCYLLLGW